MIPAATKVDDRVTARSCQPCLMSPRDDSGREQNAPRRKRIRSLLASNILLLILTLGCALTNVRNLVTKLTALTDGAS